MKVSKPSIFKIHLIHVDTPTILSIPLGPRLVLMAEATAVEEKFLSVGTIKLRKCKKKNMLYQPFAALILVKRISVGFSLSL